MKAETAAKRTSSARRAHEEKAQSAIVPSRASSMHAYQENAKTGVVRSTCSAKEAGSDKNMHVGRGQGLHFCAKITASLVERINAGRISCKAD